MSKGAIITTIVLAGLLLAAIVAFLVLSKIEEEPEEEVVVEQEEEQSLEGISGTDVYTNSDWGFEMNYPSGWRPETIADEETAFSVSFVSDSQNYEAILIDAFIPEEGDNFENAIEAQKKELAKQLELLSEENVNLGALLGYATEYRASDYFSEIGYLFYFIDTGSAWYQISYTGAGEQYAINKETIEDILKSFKTI